MYHDAGITGSVQTPGPVVAVEHSFPVGPIASPALRGARRPGAAPSARPENPRSRRGRLIYVSIAGLVVLALVAATWCVHRRVTDPVLLVYWWIGNGAVLFWTYAFFKGRRFPHLPMATGRIVAIVVAHEQDADDLRACIWSILGQRALLVDEVHVVDDGSVDRPVQPFAHPRVRWHRKKSRGKGAAQVYVLDRLEPGDWDFVLTVDGGCTLDERAIEHQLRAFSQPQVTATTGMVIVRNARQNLLTRIADVNIGTSYVKRRVSPSLPGALKIMSGAPALYRADILFRHKRRYLAAGDHGDDRFLAMYAALEGKVVGVDESIGWTRTPADLESAARQLLRWSRSWWCLIPLALTGVNRPPGMLSRLFVLCQLVVGPLATGYALIAIAVGASRGTLPLPTIVLWAALYLLVRYATTGLYLVERPETSRRGKLWTWFLLTPAEAAWNLLFVAPIKYAALLRLGWRGWQGWRDDRRTGLSAAASAEAGTVYYSGYLLPEHRS